MKIIICFLCIFALFVLKTDSRYIGKNCLQKRYPSDWFSKFFPYFHKLYNNKEKISAPNKPNGLCKKSGPINENVKNCPCTGLPVCECPTGCNCQENNLNKEKNTKCPCTGADLCICDKDSPCKGNCNTGYLKSGYQKLITPQPDENNSKNYEKKDQPNVCPCTGDEICKCPEDSPCKKTCNKV